MSMGVGELSILLCLCVVPVLVLGAVGIFFMMRKKNAPAASASRGDVAAPPPEPATARDVTFLLRFGPDHARMIESLVSQLAGRLSGPSAVRDAAMELNRALPDATHGWAGPGAPHTHARVDEHGGLLVGFRVQTRQPIDTVRDDSHAGALGAALRAVTGLPDHAIVGAQLAIAQPTDDPSAPMLARMQEASAQGMVACQFCGKQMAVYDTICPTCGGRAAR